MSNDNVTAEVAAQGIDGVIGAHRQFLSALDAGASVEEAIRDAYHWHIDPFRPDMAVAQIDQIVIRGLNDFVPDNAHPRILDCGANIGISVLNYRRQFPGAEIVAFEPDASLHAVLRKNLDANGAADVEAVKAAVWTSNGVASFLSSGADGGRIAIEQPSALHSAVRTVDLADYLTSPVDLLKLDIEGAEYDVISHLAERLLNVKNIIVECHLDQSAVTRFGSLLQQLREAGFNIVFNTFGQWRDLVRRPPVAALHFEQYVAVYGWRSATGGFKAISSSAVYLELPLLMEFFRLQESRRGPQQFQRTQKTLSRTNVTGAVKLKRPFEHVAGRSWTIQLPASLADGDRPDSPAQSKLRLFEDGRALGPPHSEHAAIQKYGAGRFSHWRNYLYFSTSDDSDPNMNGRTYVVALDADAEQ